MQTPSVHPQKSANRSLAQRRFPASTLFALACLCSAAAGASPDESILGKSMGYPVAPNLGLAFTDDQYRVGSFSGLDRISEHCVIEPSATPLPIPEAKTKPAFVYRYEGRTYTLDDYMQRQRVTALLVLKDGEIVAQQSGYDRTAEQRMLSNSMAKTILALAIGKALEAGLIRSLDDTAASYAPELSGTLYGETRIINLMRMSSGARFVEDYSGKDDHARFNRAIRNGGIVSAVKTVTERQAPEGEVFNYASSESVTLGYVLRAATGRNLCEFVSEQLWQPMGASARATWLTNPADHAVIASGNFNATVLDYARLGLLLANDGVVQTDKGAVQVMPRDYLMQMTDANRQPAAFRPGLMQNKGNAYLGYGLQTWLLPGSHRRFELLGIHGQDIMVDPILHVVVVHLAVGKDASGDASGHHMGRERDALMRGIVAHYGNW
jgi:CubicO group peptidase (beta-lactamase class C family)